MGHAARSNDRAAPRSRLERAGTTPRPPGCPRSPANRPGRLDALPPTRGRKDGVRREARPTKLRRSLRRLGGRPLGLRAGALPGHLLGFVVVANVPSPVEGTKFVETINSFAVNGLSGFAC